MGILGREVDRKMREASDVFLLKMRGKRNHLHDFRLGRFIAVPDRARPGIQKAFVRGLKHALRVDDRIEFGEHRENGLAVGFFKRLFRMVHRVAIGDESRHRERAVAKRNIL